MTDYIRRHPDGIPSISRLDKPTSGLMAIPLSAEAEEYLTLVYKERRAGLAKTYLCLVNGLIAESGEIDTKLVRV